MYSSNILKTSLDKFLGTIHVYELDIKPLILNNSYSLKLQICNSEEGTYEFPNDTLIFNVSFDEETINRIINCEVNSEYHRINEQIKNVETLINGSSQPAWTIVTVYYACFFMGNLYSKLLGRTTINFNAEDIKNIFTANSAPALTNALQDEIKNLKLNSNHIYTCYIERSTDANKVKLRLILGGDKPHQAVWSNFHQHINLISKSLSNETHELTLLKRILNVSDEKFPLPSQLRNEWNYSDHKYFSELGTKEAEKFIRLVKNRNALESWVSQQTKPSSLKLNYSTNEDKLCSLAYVYTIFLDTFRHLTSTVNDNNRPTKIKVNPTQRRNLRNKRSNNKHKK